MFERLLADVALVRSVTCVGLHVGLQAGRVRKSPAADFTIVNPLAGVGPPVDRKLREISEGLFAHLAFECLLMCVLLFEVLCQEDRLREFDTTNVTL